MDFHEIRMDQEWYRYLSAFRKRFEEKAKPEEHHEEARHEEEVKESPPRAA